MGNKLYFLSLKKLGPFSNLTFRSEVLGFFTNWSVKLQGGDMKFLLLRICL